MILRKRSSMLSMLRWSICKKMIHESKMQFCQHDVKIYNNNNNNGEDSYTSHIPVMLNEVVEILDPKPDQIIIDMTFGAGGHTKELLKKERNLRILALDQDPVAFEMAKEMAKKYKNHIIPMCGQFSDLEDLLDQLNMKKGSIDGFLFDLGCSSMQFDNADRGFALSMDGPLDMRMNNQKTDRMTAYDVISSLSEEELYKIIKVYGEERYARPIARALVESRYLFRIPKTTKELAYLVDSVVHKNERLDKLERPAHVATKHFRLFGFL